MHMFQSAPSADVPTHKVTDQSNCSHKLSEKNEHRFESAHDRPIPFKTLNLFDHSSAPYIQIRKIKDKEQQMSPRNLPKINLWENVRRIKRMNAAKTFRAMHFRKSVCKTSLRSSQNTHDKHYYFL